MSKFEQSAEEDDEDEYIPPKEKVVNENDEGFGEHEDS